MEETVRGGGDSEMWRRACLPGSGGTGGVGVVPPYQRELLAIQLLIDFCLNFLKMMIYKYIGGGVFTCASSVVALGGVRQGKVCVTARLCELASHWPARYPHTSSRTR